MDWLYKQPPRSGRPSDDTQQGLNVVPPLLGKPPVHDDFKASSPATALCSTCYICFFAETQLGPNMVSPLLGQSTMHDGSCAIHNLGRKPETAQQEMGVI